MVLGKIFGGDTIKTIGNVVDDMHFSGEEKEKLNLIENGLAENVFKPKLSDIKNKFNNDEYYINVK